MNQGAGSPGVRRAVVMPADDSIFRRLSPVATPFTAIRTKDPMPSGGRRQGKTKVHRKDAKTRRARYLCVFAFLRFTRLEGWTPCPAEDGRAMGRPTDLARERPHGSSPLRR